MTNDTISCPACGAPNEAIAGKSHMACSYCGATLTIPESLRARAAPRVEQNQSKAKPVQAPEIDASDLLRKAQPVAIKAWNLYALWTWVRWLFPACLVIFIILIVVCIALGALPFVLNLFR